MMKTPVRQQSFRRKKMTKQLTGKRDDTTLHSAARSGNLEAAVEILTNGGGSGDELKELLSKQNQAGETALYVAVEYGYVDLVEAMIKFYDSASAGVKAKNGYDAFHIAAKQGDLVMQKDVSWSCFVHFSDILRILMDALPDLSMTFDQCNTTALHSAAAKGHVEVVNFLLERKDSLATITKNNSKSALHSSARNGHLEVVKALLMKEPGLALKSDKKGQTALHMAAKGQNVEVVNVLMGFDAALLKISDNKGNTPLHIAARKGRSQIIQALLNHDGVEKDAINKLGETALDTAEKSGHVDIAIILQKNRVHNADSLKLTAPTSRARELKQTVSDINHEVHDEIEHTRQTGKHVRGMAKRINKLQEEGLNNAIGSTTLVAVLIATVTFGAIFTVPGQFTDDSKNVPPGTTLGEAKVAPRTAFQAFFVFDSLALFLSLAVVVVQTSVVVVERKAKKQLMSVINKLMWLACVFVSVAFLAMSYIVVGSTERWLAVGVAVIGTIMMAATLGTLCYWVVVHRIEAANLRSIRRSGRSSKSQSLSISVMSDPEMDTNDYKNLYAV